MREIGECRNIGGVLLYRYGSRGDGGVCVQWEQKVVLSDRAVSISTFRCKAIFFSKGFFP